MLGAGVGHARQRFGHMSGLIPFCCWGVLDLFLAYFGHTSAYIGHVLDVSSACFLNVWDMCWICFGDVSRIFS